MRRSDGQAMRLMQRRSPARPQRTLITRLAVVAVTLTLGLVLEGCRSERALPDLTLPPVVTEPGWNTLVSTTSSTTTTLPPTTTEPLVVEGATVVIANASNVNGAAGRLSEEFAALQFTMGEPTNGWGPWNQLDATAVYVAPGGEDVGRSVAQLMGLAVTRMPTPVWITGGTETLRGATVLVVLGKDRASTYLADMAP